mgnify:CR=1 FL=1
MKFIGQSIYDFIARFRSDVYLQNISSGTIASGGNLGLDANNKIVKATVGASDLTISDFAGATIITSSESFADNDTTLMTSAAINDRIESFGYTTNTGDITGVDLTGASPVTIGSETGTTSGNYSATISVDAATASSRGVVELATIAEVTTGTDALRAVTPDGLKDGYQGSANVTTLGTIATGTWRGTVIENLYTSASGKRYGSYIKILPSDFMINDDAASPLSFKDGSNSGVHVNDTASEAIAFVTIPEGMKATHVDIYGTHNKTIKVWEVDVDSSFDFTSTTKGTGSMNTTLDITDVNATADNYLAIQVTLTATSQRIWGGKVTIAAQ